MKRRRLIVILQYEEIRGSRVVTSSGRCISVTGQSIPWFKITRQIFVATVASLCREIAQRNAFLEALESIPDKI